MSLDGRKRENVEEEGRRIVERLGGRWTPSGGMCRCPAHDDRTPSLSVRPGRTRLLLHCFAGCAAPAIIRALGSGGLLEPSAGEAEPRAFGNRSSRGSAAALRLWDEARPIAGSPASAYLGSRGLRCLPADLRYHPRTPDGRAPLTQFRPAMIAAVRDGSGLVAIHRTFLDRCTSGLALIPAPRRGLGRFGRGAVRLGAGTRLGIAEGIETALSAAILFGVPCWATLGTERFGRIELPAEVDELLLFLDHDAAGRRAERGARRAFAHVRCIQSHVPDPPGADWNDVLRRLLAGRRER